MSFTRGIKSILCETVNNARTNGRILFTAEGFYPQPVRKLAQTSEHTSHKITQNRRRASDSWFFVFISFLEPHIAVTLSPECARGGSIFITDLRVKEYQKEHQAKQHHLSPKVVFLSQLPQFASLVSQEAIDQIIKKQNESHKTADSENGIKIPDDCLLKSAMTLSHAPSVAIVTSGVSEKQLAAVACIAKALSAQEKEITILAAENVVSEWKAFVAKCKTEEVVMRCIPVTSFGATSEFDGLEPRFYSTSLNSMVIVNEEGKNNRYHLLFSITRPTEWLSYSGTTDLTRNLRMLGLVPSVPTAHTFCAYSAWSEKL